MSYSSIVISAGHGSHVPGASGILIEVDEARRVVESVAYHLDQFGCSVESFYDNTSHTQNENLAAIVNYHNAQDRQLDVSVHFNAFQPTDKPMGTEVLYVTQEALAAQIADAIAGCGFVNRGAKYRGDLYFLNHTAKPAILIEVCFVDSAVDAELYREQFAPLCAAIAQVLGGPAESAAAA